jgi:hypothetical protein
MISTMLAKRCSVCGGMQLGEDAMIQGPMRAVFHISTHAGRSQHLWPFGASLLHHSHFGRRHSFQVAVHQAISFFIIAAILTLFALPASAQTQMQFSFFSATTTPSQVVQAFPHPIGAGPGTACLAFVYFEGGSGTFTLTSLNNTWTAGASSDDAAIFIAQPCKPGPDTITTSRQVMPRYTWGWVAEYSGLGAYDTGGSFEAATTIPTVALNLSQANEFIVAGFKEHGPVGVMITPVAGLKLTDTSGGNTLGLIDGTATSSGAYAAGFTSGGPNQSYTPTWAMLAVAFKPFNPPPFIFHLAGFGTFTFPMNAPPDCSDGLCSIVACDATSNQCVTFLPGQSGSIVFRKPSGDMVIVMAGP